MKKIDCVKKVQLYLDELQEKYEIENDENLQNSIDEYESGELTEEDFDELYKDFEAIDLTLPDEPEYLDIAIDDFFKYMSELSSLSVVDSGSVRTTHIRQATIDTIKRGWHVVDDKLKSYVFEGDDYNVRIIEKPFLVGIQNIIDSNYDEDYGVYPCSNYLALELEYTGETIMSIDEENEVFDRITFFLGQKIGDAVYRTDFIDVHDVVDDFDDVQLVAKDEVVNIKTLTKSTPLTKLYEQAKRAEDVEIRFLYFYKIIEYISPVVAKMNAYENLNKRLDLLATCERDYKFLDSIFAISRKYDEDVKDDFLCISVIQTCVDVIPIWYLFPESKQKTIKKNLGASEVSDESLSVDQLRSLQKQVANILYATRNKIVHAKSNFVSKGLEFSIEEMESANEIMAIVANSIIKWNERQTDYYRIK